MNLNKALAFLQKKFTPSFVVGNGNTRHFLITGDSLEVMKFFPDESIDLVVTDPPYNRGLKYGKLYKDRMKKEEYFGWCFEWIKDIERILKRNGSAYVITYPEIAARFLVFIEDNTDLSLRRWIVWHYPTNIGHSKKNFTRSHRAVLFLTKSKNYTFNRVEILQHYKNPEVKKIKERIKKGSKGRAAYDVLRFFDLIEINKDMIDVLEFNLLKNVSKERFVREHPCQLPPSLVSVFIKVSSNPGDYVLDPFAGTFVTSAVSKELNRNSIGIEIEPGYTKLGLKRVKNGIRSGK